VLVQFARAKYNREKPARQLWQEFLDASESIWGSESDSTVIDPSEPLRADTSDIEDHRSFVIQLYDALSEHFTPDRCQYDWKAIFVNLRLNWWEISTNNDALCLGLFVLKSESGKIDNSIPQFVWQDYQVCVERKQRVRFDVIRNQSSRIPETPKIPCDKESPHLGNTSDDTRDEDQSSTDYESASDEFCQYLVDRTVAQYRFEHATDFKLQKCSQPERPFSRSSTGISLNDIIGTRKLKPRMKLYLSFLLIRTFWQYCESRWMRHDWSKESVHFMLDSVDGRPKFVSVQEPFLQACFDKNDSGAKMTKPIKHCPSSRQSKTRNVTLHRAGPRPRTHQYPSLLGLGIMLLEIELDEKLEHLKPPGGEDPDIVNIRHDMAARVLRDPNLWPPKDIWQAVKRPIEVCITADSHALGNSGKDLRHNFYQNVLCPSKAFLAATWPDTDYQRLEPIEVNVATSLQCHISKHEASIYPFQEDEDSRGAHVLEAPSSARLVPASPSLVSDYPLGPKHSASNTQVSDPCIGTTMSTES
jgi:hypothetical protein